ncbi:hypothetical protein H5410_022118 [Solanum commersonii]|uniref:CCHC-type domain-containing protein n=1 Tax=Solanum commersonii TaxID=4109 RepID=A0A9J5ZEH8_SOLCO|nr:hypothetical protein H5410_022118 [Solanum commersonii]
MWEFHFRIFVQGKILFGILDGSTTEPNEDKEKQVWHDNNAHVISWILNSVHADVALSLLPFNLVAEMQKHLKKETCINTLASVNSSYTIDAAMYTSKGAHKSYTQSSFQKFGPQCFECKEYSHIASHCKKRNICNYCKKPGHIILECNQCPNTRQTKHKAYQASEANVSQADITSSSLDPKALQKVIQDSVAAALPGLFLVFSLLPILEQNLTSPNEDPNGIIDEPGQSDAFPTDNSGNSTLSHNSLNTSFTDSFDNNDYSDGEPLPSDQINSSIPSLRYSERKTSSPDRYGYSSGRYGRSYALLAT